ncbi:MarR family winged helix-turn-helix transcriptional regulator [Actinacidiphila oryziradicis]|uniref:MarR family winged helix-turn-helix transcriptional regulator n=1 Tax=Actinacidiphila oryziradicis TaxID=2571141 RepID=UPI001B7FFF72|nr:MarR family winged helix-turn-helix transcriptional regulator [Actinacidiphila oryziradicis]
MLATTFGNLRQAFALHVGISRPRLQVLMRLWRAGETSHSDLRHLLSLDGASVTRLIKEFEAEGLITRRIDPGDNRYTLARLTPAGEQAAAEPRGSTRPTRSDCSTASQRTSGRPYCGSSGAWIPISAALRPDRAGPGRRPPVLEQRHLTQRRRLPHTEPTGHHRVAHHHHARRADTSRLLAPPALTHETRSAQVGTGPAST